MSAPAKMSPERIGFSNRLTETLKTSHGLPASPTTVAREFNFRFIGKPVTVHAARKWLVGESIPTQDKMRALAEWLGVSVDWLRFGSTPAQGGAAVVRNREGEASPLDSLVRLFLALPHRERILARDFIEMLVRKSGRGVEHATQLQEDSVRLDDFPGGIQIAEQYK